MSIKAKLWVKKAKACGISHYTRFSILPLLTLAIWSRVWLGWWCLIPIALTLFWTWYNPRAFNKPASTKNWASRVTLGECLYLNRKLHPIPELHNGVLMLTSILSFIGVIALIYGLSTLDFWATLCGTLAIMISKTWFCDRMVWLYIETHPDG